MGPTSTRKEREIRERESLLLDAAARILAEEGFHAVTMERIASEIEYSKGTVYQHVSSKEDVLGKLAIRNARRRVELFSRALKFGGTTRERMAAVGVAYDLLMQIDPNSCNAEAMFHSTAVQAKVSEETLAEHKHIDEEGDGVIADVIREAIESGELPLTDEAAVSDLHYGLWAISWGAYQIAECIPAEELRARGFQSPHTALRANQDRLLDGYGWRPLAGEHDYAAARERVLREVFPEELARLAMDD